MLVALHLWNWLRKCTDHMEINRIALRSCSLMLFNHAVQKDRYDKVSD